MAPGRGDLPIGQRRRRASIDAGPRFAQF